MATTPIALLLVGTLACAPAAFASPRHSTAARLGVSLTVVRSCRVTPQASGSVGVSCTRGALDRIVVTVSEPRVVPLERDGATMRTLIDAGAADVRAAERFVTLQF